ncbi:MAG: flagellar basal body rod protein FlgB [Betaproteobacteria bacterium]|jgi:flagellar basal-body rod protein FlgB|nr:flagellar basal body rod protein FlgB [Betaproteobacteria bacterium]
MGLLSNPLGIHERSLAVRSQRLEVLAQNIANADTPQYKARDVDFRAVLARQQDPDNRMTSTQSTHFDEGAGLAPDGLRYRKPFNTSFDGNTVEMSVEQAQYGRAAADYQATLNFLESRVNNIRRALRGE